MARSANPAGADLPAIEARLRAILAPYEDRLEWATIYGNAMLRRPGSRAHDWFAFVKPATNHVSFFLLPIHTHPQLLGGISPTLRKRLTGKSTFNFSTLDEDVFAELEALTARSFEAYTRTDRAGR